MTLKDSSLVNNINPIDFFSADTGFVYVYKKTEKLATALYMVTNLFGDSEPMKWSLRSKISNLLSFIISFKNVIKSREDEFSNDVKTYVLEIVSLLEISARSGLVSTMNFNILRAEFINLVESLSRFKKDDISNSSFALKENFFDISKDKNEKNHQLSNVDTLTSISTNPNSNQKDKFHQELLSTVFPKKTNRQNIIINLLKKKKSLSIKDISQVIQDCSEKTIQRELLSLVKVGILKKEGERRWSKYSLVNSI